MGSSDRFTVADVVAPPTPTTTVKSKTFAQTCNKLSQFLKERRSVGEFGFLNSSNKLQINGGKEINGPNNTTMNLFPNNMEKEGNNVSKGENPLSFFPLMSSTCALINQEESTKNMAHDMRELLKTNGEPANTSAASMTIFYGGRVLVFDDLPTDKALEIMSFASHGIVNSSVQIQTHTQTSPNNIAITEQATQGTVLQDQTSLSDLPIARRVSLHRFMEKRKDRIAANVPYPLHNSRGNRHEKDNLIRNYNQKSDHKIELMLFQ